MLAAVKKRILIVNKGGIGAATPTDYSGALVYVGVLSLEPPQMPKPMDKQNHGSGHTTLRRQPDSSAHARGFSEDQRGLTL